MAYSRHTSRFIIAYLTFLPFALQAVMGWATVPVMVGLTFLVRSVSVQRECCCWW